MQIASISLCQKDSNEAIFSLDGRSSSVDMSGTTTKVPAGREDEATPEHKERDHSSHVLDAESLDHFMHRKHEGDELADGLLLAEQEAKQSNVESVKDKDEKEVSGSEKKGKKASAVDEPVKEDAHDDIDGLKRKDHKSDVLQAESMEHFMKRKHRDDEVADGVLLAEQEAKVQEQSSSADKVDGKSAGSSDSDIKKRDHKSDVLEAESMEHFMKRKHQGDEIAVGVLLAEQEAKQENKDQPTSSDKVDGKPSGGDTDGKERDHKSDVLETESMEHFMKRKHQGDEIAVGVLLAEQEAKQENKDQPTSSDKVDGKPSGGDTDGKERDHKSDVLETESMEHFMKRKHQGDEQADGLLFAEEEAKKLEQKEASKNAEHTEIATETTASQTEGSFDFVEAEGSPRSNKDSKSEITADKSQEGQLKRDESVDPKNKTRKPKSKPRIDDVDLDQMVQAAEETLGESKKKTEGADEISFEDVLAKSVLEESVTEAANEMDKIKSKRKKLTKSKRRSDSVDSESDKDRSRSMSADVETVETVDVASDKTDTKASDKTDSKASDKLNTKDKTVPTDMETEKNKKNLEKSSSQEKKSELSEDKLKFKKTVTQEEATLGEVDGNYVSRPMDKSLITKTIVEEVHSEEGKVVETPVTSDVSQASESVSKSVVSDSKVNADRPLQRGKWF